MNRNPSILPSRTIWIWLVLASAVAGLFAASGLIVRTDVAFSRWGGVLLLSSVLYVPFLLPQAVAGYALLGAAARATRWSVLGEPAFRFGLAFMAAALFLPLSVRHNVRSPGLSLSFFHLGPYLLILALALLVGIVAGLVLLWLARKQDAAAAVRTRRRVLTVVIAILAAAAVQAGVSATSERLRSARSEATPGDERPNAILITVDTLRADHLQSYGYAKATDPEIQRHFRDGLRFEDAICPAPVTRPTHAAMLTGIHPALLGMRWNERVMPDDVPTLAESLQAEGYETAAFVSGWPLFGEVSGLARGFDHYSDVFSPVLAVDHSVDELPVLMILRKLRIVDTLQRDAASVTDDALAWLEGSRGSPFFIWIHYYDPHHLYEPPLRFAREVGLDPKGPRNSRGLYSRVIRGVHDISPLEHEQALSLYDGEIRFVDANVGKLLDRVEALGLRDRTVVLLTADHGETLFECVAAESLAFAHGRWLKERDLRVPFLLRGPGVPSGVRDESVTAEAMDVMPTLLRLLDLEVPDGVQGRDLLDPQAVAEPKPVLSINSPESDYPLRVAARTREYKLILEPDTANAYLYHLPTDSDETRNVIGEVPDIAAALRAVAQALPRITRTDDQAPDAEELDRLRSLGYIR